MGAGSLGRLALLLMPLLALLLGAGSAAAAPAPSGGTVVIPAGEFIPLFSAYRRQADQAPLPVQVPSFRLDVYPVSNAEYLEFVRANPKWRRSQVPRLFADRGYLSQWEGDTDLGHEVLPEGPVTRVSWFAAKAYCAWRGKTLPTTLQWERAAAASASAPDAEDDPAFLRMILDWYGRPTPQRLPPVTEGFRNLWGVYNMHGLVWEWTLDFNSALVTGESRADSSLERGLYCGAAAAGATSFKDYAAFLRYGFRSSLSGAYTVSSLGFRCAAPES
ncbi:MAG TPA: formylglycine-generating enzyme family protein [bacterium]|nr:formylglycine-generating enzyme family protein [bacterium]